MVVVYYMMKEETKKLLTGFFSKYPSKKFKKGEIVLKPGDKANYVDFIKSGYVSVYTVNDSGREISMSFFKPMLYFTTIFAITGIANKFYFKAVSNVELWMAPKNDFWEFCKENTQVGKTITEIISGLFLDLIETTGKLLAGDSMAKVAMIVATVTDNKSHFALTHKMIGNLTGLTRETVTIQMLKLEKLKLVDNKNRKVTILDRKGLDKIIEG